MAKTHRTGETKYKNGKLIHKYSNGDWRYEDGKMAIRGPHLQSTNITKETAKDMQRMGVESRRQKKQDAILKATLETIGPEAALLVTTPHDAAAHVAGELWKETLEHDQNLKDRVYVYERIGADAGLVSKYKDSGGVSGVGVIVKINISDKATEGMDEEDAILEAIYKELDEDDVPF